MDRLPTLPAPTSMDDFLVHPFFKMDEHYPRSRSSTGSTRPVSISSPQDITKLSRARKGSSASSPGTDHFYADAHALMQWSYNSDEEVASPVARDDLSATSSLTDEDHPSVDDDEDDVEDDFDLVDFPEQLEDDNLRVEQQCRHAEAVQIVPAGRPKVIVLWKLPGSPVMFKRPASPTELEFEMSRRSKSTKTAADDTASTRSREASTLSSSKASFDEASSTLSKRESTSSKASSTSGKAPSTSSEKSISLTRSPATKKKNGDEVGARDRRRPSLPVILTRGDGGSWNPGVAHNAKGLKEPQSARPTTPASSKPSPWSNAQKPAASNTKTRKIPSPLNLKALTRTVRRKNAIVETNEPSTSSAPILPPLSAAGPRRGSLSKLIPRPANARAPAPVLPAYIPVKAIREDDEEDLMHPGYGSSAGSRRDSLSSIPSVVDVLSKKALLYKSSENVPPSSTIDTSE